MPPSFFLGTTVPLLLMVPWELLKDVDGSRITDSDLTIFLLWIKNSVLTDCSWQALGSLGTRLGMPRLALKVLDARAQT